jgi:hypothetical protein
MDLYSTIYMMEVIREKAKTYTWMRDRYFAKSENIFKTNKVYVDYDDGEGNLLAPFVISRVGKVPMLRGGYETREIEPAYIAPSRPLSIDQLEKRMAGESLVSTLTPEQRESVYLVNDLDFLDKAITRREEWMCAETMLLNACTMRHIGDKEDKGKDLVAKYYEGTDNPGVFKPSEKWDVGTETKRGTWYNDVVAQVESLMEAGRPVTDLVVGSQVAEMILSDPWVMKILDNRRMEMGQIDPRWVEEGVSRLGVLNFAGVPLEIFVYRGTYQERDAKGKLSTKSYLPTAGVLLAAPNTGKLSYAAVTQVEMDNQTYTRTGTRIPKHNVNVDSNQKETILTARPIAIPNMKGAWRACTDVLSQ